MSDSVQQAGGVYPSFSVKVGQTEQESSFKLNFEALLHSLIIKTKTNRNNNKNFLQSNLDGKTDAEQVYAFHHPLVAAGSINSQKLVNAP